MKLPSLKNKDWYSNPLIVLRYWPFIIAGLLFYLLGWAVWILINQPYTGLDWSLADGAITFVDPHGQVAGQLQVGDKILSFDGMPVYESRGLPGRRIGDRVVLEVTRQEHTFKHAINLVAPPYFELIRRLTVIPIALVFWLLGTMVLSFGQPGRLVLLFFLFCQGFSAILSLGSISAYGPIWAWQLFGLLLWWIGPLTFHTHLVLSEAKYPNRQGKLILGIYALTLLFSLVDLQRLMLQAMSPLLSFKYIWLASFLILSGGYMLFRSLRISAPEYRRKTRIASLSALISFLPFVLLSLLPEALFRHYLLPYEVSFLALPILPLGYSYVILSHRLVQYQRKINYHAANALAAFVVGVLYAFILIVLSNAFPPTREQNLSLWLLFILMSSFTIHPAFQRFSRWMNQTLYDGWLDDRSVLKTIYQDLKQVKGEPSSIAFTLCQALQRTMQIEYVNFVLADGRFVSAQISASGVTASEPLIAPAQVAAWLDLLQEKAGRELGNGDELLRVFAEAENEMLDKIIGPQPQLWLLFGEKTNWQGLLVLGYRRGRGEFDGKDLEILEVVLRQAEAALENATLLAEVQLRSRQIRDLHRQVLKARDEERKRVARDLHDMTIQTLVGLNYQITRIKERMNAETGDELQRMQASLREVLVDLRRICADLRPPAIDTLGLELALESRVSELRSQELFDIRLSIQDLDSKEIPDEVSMCIYRFFQEALLNIQKHAQAQNVVVDLAMNHQNWAVLSIEDDGNGFQLPARIEELTTYNHFGLVGLKEQVEAVNGHIEIRTEPGKGCQITASIPLKPNANDVPSINY